MHGNRLCLWFTLASGAASIGCPAEPDDDQGFALSATEGPATTSATDSPTGSSESDDTGSPMTDGSGDPGSGSGSTTGEPQGPCGAEGTCVESAPEGWFGPLVMHRSDGTEEPPPCGEGYPETGLTLTEGFNDPGPAVCECSCSVSVATMCSGYIYPDAGGTTCSTFGELVQLNDQCAEDLVIDGGSAYLYLFQQGTPFCQQEKNTELPEPQWEATVTSCRTEELDIECDEGRVCAPTAPEGFESELCIFAQGDLECPPGEYAEKTLLYSGVQDDRSCSACQCGEAPAVSCDAESATYEFYAGNNCDGEMLMSSPPNQCSGAVTGAASIGLAYQGDTTCPVMTMPEPEGTIAPTGPFTYCCQSP